MRATPSQFDRRTVTKGVGATLAGSALAGGGAAGSAADSTPADATDRESAEYEDGNADGTAVIAHRGFAGQYPENTLEAVRNASHGGPFEPADMVEVDVVPTEDGRIVTFHDDGLAERDGGERGLTDERGVVWETPSETVTSAEVLESGETVPLFEEVMDAIPSSVGVNIEFKNPGSTDVRFGENLSGDALDEQKELWQPFTETVLDIADEHENDVLVSSFYEAAIARVREVDPDVPVAFLFWDDIEAGLDVTRTYDCEAMNVPWNMVAGTPFFGDPYYTEGPYADVDLVDVAREEDRELNVWTVRSWYQATQLADAGVDGIIADFPALLD